MKRQPKPHYKASHKAWYVNLNGKQIRLASEEEGKERAMEVYYQVMAGRLPPEQNQSVAVILYRFLQHHESSPASTRRFYSRPVRSFIDYIGPALRVSDVQPRHVENWLTERHSYKRLKSGKLTDKPTSSTYRHNLVRAVKSAFQWAEDKGYIAKSPVRKVKVPPQYSRGDDAYLEPEQWAKVLTCEDESLLDLLIVMYETGCRPQEVRRVEARHFDRAAKCWEFPVEESKGKKEKRVVLLSDQAFEICQRRALKHPDGSIFRNHRGKPWTTTGLDCHCARLSRSLKFRVTPYMVRHTFATEKIIQGVDLVTIATLMGHRDLKMLMKIYQHVRRRGEHLRKALGA
jgi:integrase